MWCGNAQFAVAWILLSEVVSGGFERGAGAQAFKQSKLLLLLLLLLFCWKEVKL
jgi:hypothetical protein